MVAEGGVLTVAVAAEPRTLVGVVAEAHMVVEVHLTAAEVRTEAALTDVKSCIDSPPQSLGAGFFLCAFS